MTIVEQLSDIIRSRTHIPTPGSGGWSSVRCQVCNDHHNKKRGGWKLEPTSIGYHCFNCGAKFVVDNETTHFSSNVVNILEAYGITSDDLGIIKFNMLTARKSTNIKVERSSIVYPKPLNKPKFFTPLSQSTSIWRDVTIEYLMDRGIDPNCHDFHVVDKSGELAHKPWYGRVIIPVYRNDQLIFWQGRDMTGKSKLKYLSSDVVRESVLFGYDLLSNGSNSPLYVVEGAFDALTVGGIATFSNKLTKSQIEILNKSPRQKIVIPDKTGSGSVMAKQALDQGWSISIPDYGSCKDPTEAKAKYGHLYVMKAIIDGTMSATKAKILLAHLVD